ncbi:MAG: hypothetical protein RIR01_1899 [Bacteroidota bacterium]|jgi:flagellar biosynthesis component FlhA
MKQLYTKLLGSFDTVTKNSFSARKLTAFVIAMLVIVIHGFWIKNSCYKSDFSLFPEILLIDYGMMAVCLGLTTFENIKLKNGKKSNTSTTNIP